MKFFVHVSPKWANCFFLLAPLHREVREQGVRNRAASLELAAPQRVNCLLIHERLNVGLWTEGDMKIYFA